MILGPLYKISTTGKITEWSIEISGNMYRTITGYVGMILTTSAWTECVSKNIGKSNGTTPAEQAIAEAKSLFDKRKELGAWEDIKDAHKITFIAPMLAKKWEDEKHRVKYPVASQKKYDGIRCVVCAKGMFSRNGKEIISAPHIMESLSDFFKTYPDIILDGELYTNKEFDFNKIISCVKKTKPTLQDLIESKTYISYFIYDIISSTNIYKDRYQNIKKMFNDGVFPETCIMSEIDIVYNEKEVQEYHDKYVSEGFEGQIIRTLHGLYETKRSKNLLKNKVFDDAEFVITGVKEGVGKLTNKVGKLVFDGFESAVNGEHSYLEKLWQDKDNLIGLTATVRYFGLTTTETPVPRFPKVISIGRETYE